MELLGALLVWIVLYLGGVRLLEWLLYERHKRPPRY